jgi:hypothetical protein
MASEQRKGESLQAYRDRLNREFAEKFPRLASLSQHKKGPWTEGDSKWFEAMTGEKDTFPTVPDPPDAFL